MNTIIYRIIFILLFIVLFWILFIIIYLSSRLVIRFLSNLKSFQYDSTLSSNTKISQAFVLSSNQYESFRPYRSDSLFSNNNFTLINYHNSQYQQTKKSLLEYYLKTSNPLEIDLTNTNQQTITTSNVKVISYDEIPSEIDTHTIDNCYSFNCTNKQRLYQIGRYARLKQQEHCSSIMNIGDDHQLSECSTKLTSITLPIVMITNCSDSQRLHTDIIEMNDYE